MASPWQQCALAEEACSISHMTLSGIIVGPVFAGVLFCVFPLHWLLGRLLGNMHATRRVPTVTMI